MTRLRFPLAASLLLALAALVGCSGPSGKRAPHDCTTDAECPSASFCRTGACVADQQPVASIAGPTTASAHMELTFDASGSSDPDGDIVSYAWSVSAVSAPCDAETGPTDGVVFRPLFPCPGRFELRLVVADRGGVASDIARAALVVSPQTHEPPGVVMGEPLSLAHRCEGAPLACAAVGSDGAPSFGILATGRAEDGSSALAYRWEWLPPAGLGAGTPVVKLSPSASVQSPTVSITTAGTTIAGDWTFVVTVTDGHGLSTRASQKVSVGNRPPVVTGGGALELPHTYDAASRTYLAAGAVSPTVVDPDGDPVELAWDFQSSDRNGCTFGFTGAAGAFSVACREPHELIGGVSRAIALIARDVNGGVGGASWGVTATNRPPRISAVPSTLAFDHGVDDAAAPRSFVVQGMSPFTASDPDGDPLPPVALKMIVSAGATRSGGRQALDPATGAPSFLFWTDVSAPAEFRHADDSSPFSVQGDVADPWSGAEPVSFRVEVRDRAPVMVGPAATQVSAGHVYDGAAYLASARLAAFSDPDGDPLLVSGEGAPLCGTYALTRAGALSTASVACRLPYDVRSGGVPPLAQLLAPQPLRYTVSDPWGLSGTAESVVQVTNAAPQAALPADFAFDAGSCAMRVIRGTGEPRPSTRAGVGSVGASAVDPENDPVVLSWGPPSCGSVAPPASSTCVSGAAGCGAARVTTCAGDWTVASVTLPLTVSDGSASGAAVSTTITTTCQEPY